MMGHKHALFSLITLVATVYCKCLPPSPLYHVTLDHCGPEPKNEPPIDLPHAVAPTLHQPLKALPHPPIPAPKVLSHHIVHYKTILKPQVYQRVITVPKVYKFLRKHIRPVVEHIPYQAKPICLETAPLVPASPLGLPSSPLVPASPPLCQEAPPVPGKALLTKNPWLKVPKSRYLSLSRVKLPPLFKPLPPIKLNLPPTFC